MAEHPDVDYNQSLQILKSGLGLQTSKISAPSLASVNVEKQITAPPTGLNNVHEAYWRALKAHQDAEASYNVLKAELESMTSNNLKPGRSSSGNSEVFAQAYVPLLQQRETLRRLKVIETAVSSVVGAQNDPSTTVLDEYLKSRAGEIPLLPRANTQLNDHSEAAEQRTFELKRAVLLAKQTVDVHHSSQQSNGTAQHTVDAQIFALKEARNELIAWIEQKLGVISNAQADNARPTETLAIQGEHPPIHVTKSEIGQIYEQYIATRQWVLQALQHPQTTSVTRPDSPELNRNVQAMDESAAAAVGILPFISPLMSMRAEEHGAAQVMPFVSNQTEKASRETSQLLRRLADESHLVQPGSDHGKAWATASAASSAALGKYVAERVNAGVKNMEKAESMVRFMDELPELLRSASS